MPDFAALGLGLNLAIFGAGAVAVWIAGTLVSGYADQIATKTGLGEAFVGLILLAGVTSLPEIATSITASAAGSSSLAVNNLLGSIAMQVALLAVVDALIGRAALTSVIPDPVVMLQGAINVCLLCVVAVAAVVGDVAFFGAGGWTWGLAVATAYSFWMLTNARGRKPWTANLSKREEKEQAERHEPANASALSLALKTAAAAAVVLVSGSVVALSGDAIAQESGIGGSFMGFAFVAIATSLPEASATFSAVRRRAYTLALSGIFGTNILNVGLLFGVDAVSAGGPVLDGAGPFGAVAAIIGAAVTALFLAGLAERRDRTFLRMGHDSLAVLVTYLAGLALLYAVRGEA